MRRLLIVIACLAMMLFAAALPAVAAADGELLGSGATSPDNGEEAAAVPEETVDRAAPATQTVGEDVLAATGLDSGALLLVGVGLMTAGVAGVIASRKRASR